MSTPYTVHLADHARPDYTACGEPWQGWQAPTTDSYELTPGTVELPPHDKTDDAPVRLCRACQRAAFALAAGPTQEER